MEPTHCNPGTFAAKARSKSCELCPIGKFQPSANATTCLLCTDDFLGVYCPHEGTSTPTPCLGGTYSNQTGLSSSDECAPVEFG